MYGGKNPEFPCDDARIWLERMAEKGWTAPEWKKEYGGAGLSEQENKILQQELGRLGCRKPITGHGFWMLGPALLEFGTEEQKRLHLPRIARGEIRWCQGYSEPGAGSDLASLRCKAEDKGDHFLVNGQKCWTSSADKSDWIFCLVRTSNTGKKQVGITFLLIDMETPGITVKPVPLITGDAHFCDTFLDNVVVPKENVVGEVDKGWAVAKALLVHERAMMADLESTMPKVKYSIVEYAKKYLEQDKDGKLRDATMRDRITTNLINKRAIDLTQARAYEEGRARVFDIRVASIFKYIGTENQKDKAKLLVDIMGFNGVGWDDDNFTEDEHNRTYDWMSSQAFTIAGGSSEVQLNIIATKSLGLPES